ncbi:MAG TPA: ATP-binding protein, partial [Planctomycetaceae bacterium]|nr:ATP-binding protein [Planctomycetaceae bacterium]
PEMIGRALVSLAVHAVKSCGNSGRILVWALEDRQKRQMTLGVTGNGSRVGQDGPPHDFGQYEAPARKRRNGQKGFRLGLSVAKKLVHRNFGELTELPTDGPGTALACSLPLSIPEEILQRYLLRLHQGPRSRAAVSAARAWVEAPHDSDSIASIDKLFHFALRPDDLVFRIGKAEWMFVLAEKCPGESRFLARLEDVRKDIDRHRLRGELPEIEMKMEGAWSLAADTSDVLSRIVMLLTPLETRHATIDDAPAGQILENAAASA